MMQYQTKRNNDGLNVKYRKWWNDDRERHMKLEKRAYRKNDKSITRSCYKSIHKTIVLDPNPYVKWNDLFFIMLYDHFSIYVWSIPILSDTYPRCTLSDRYLYTPHICIFTFLVESVNHHHMWIIVCLLILPTLCLAENMFLYLLIDLQKHLSSHPRLDDLSVLW